ncbi:LysR family transcriptional regulator [Dinoroseobacter sp. S76]|uniref:LysR family transcriptional regulator n=1 Tax=Dinoroseobacter sp. S76 TaxID=3415124 RepID=UPI003C7D05D5
MALDLKQVESFVAVAETRSFSLAAERTHTVQSAISAHIAALEARLGRQLVARGRGKPVRVTAEGAAFLVQARRLLALAEEMTHGPAAIASRPTVKLGTTVTFALSVVPRALRRLAAGTGPKLDVTTRTARSHDLLDLLDRGEIDMAVVLDQGPRPSRRVTLPSDLIWVGAAPLAWQAGAPLPLAFLEDARDLRRHAFAALDPHPEITPVLRTAPDPVGLRATLAGGEAITLLPAIARTAPLADLGPELGLPPPGQVQISIYGPERGASATALREALTHVLSMLNAPAALR